jgi:CTP synthase
MPYTNAFSQAFRRKSTHNRFFSVHGRGFKLILSYRTGIINFEVTKLLHEETGEIKTKPAQNGLRSLRETGLIPDLLMCRSKKPLTEAIKLKIAGFSQLEPEEIIDVCDCSNIYKVPLLLNRQNVLKLIIEQLKLPKLQSDEESERNMDKWKGLSE